jgi:hypothetical protein
VANELSLFKDRCYRLNSAMLLKKPKSQSYQKKLTEEMKQHKKVLAACGNPDEFAGPVLGYLQAAVIDIIPLNLLPIARKMCQYWTEAEKNQLAKYCMDLLKTELWDWPWPARGSKINVLAEAIHTVGVCGTGEQCFTLTPLCKNLTYRAPLLNAFALQGINIDWIYNQFKEALSKWNPIQDQLRALGISMQRNRPMPPGSPDESEVVNDIMSLIESMPIQPNEIVIAVITLGLICDQRASAVNPVPETLAEKAKVVIAGLRERCENEAAQYAMKACTIADKLICGNSVSEDEEQYLLGVIKQE